MLKMSNLIPKVLIPKAISFREFEIATVEGACQPKAPLSLPINFYQGEAESFDSLSHRFLTYEKLKSADEDKQISDIVDISSATLQKQDEELESELLKNALSKFTTSNQSLNPLRKPYDQKPVTSQYVNFGIYEVWPLPYPELTIQFATIYKPPMFVQREHAYAELPAIQTLLDNSISNDQGDEDEEHIIPLDNVPVSPPKPIRRLVRQQAYAELPTENNSKLENSSELACAPVGLNDNFSDSMSSSANGDVLSYDESIRLSLSR